MPLVHVEKGKASRPAFEFLKVPPQREVLFLGEDGDNLAVFVHFMGTGSLPCLGDECPHCPLPSRPAGYCPVAWNRVGFDGRPVVVAGILALTEATVHLAKTVRKGDVYRVGRKNNQRNGRLELDFVRHAPATPRPAFDVLQVMQAVWGSLERQLATRCEGSDAEKPLSIGVYKPAAG